MKKKFALLFALLTVPLIGNSEAPKFATIGNTEFLFYMTEAKKQCSQDLVKNLNAKQLLLAVDMYQDPYVTIEVSAIASIKPEETALDPLGNRVMDDYSDRVMGIIKKDLGIEIQAATRELNLIVSQDAHKYHQDQFEKQYDYLHKNHQSLPPCKIIHDLTLIDWNMSEGTISGTIFQDEGGDRLLVALFPKSVVGILTAESPIYPENNQPPVFPGPKTLPYHAVLSPIDLHGQASSGSSKGQRISTVIRGVVSGDPFSELRESATRLTPFRPILYKDQKGLLTLHYEQGLLLKECPEQFKVELGWNRKLPDQENVMILNTQTSTHTKQIRLLKEMFDLSEDYKTITVYHFIKKDGGFSQCNELGLDIPEGAKIVLVNSSTLPDNYKYFNVAENLTTEGYPWIHLYQFPKNMAMLMDVEKFNRLLLTPLEELIYRDEIIDNQQVDGVQLLPKLSTRIDVFIFSKITTEPLRSGEKI